MLLAALRDHRRARGARHLAGVLEGGWPLALVADERVLELHRPELGGRLASTHSVPSGEAAKPLDVVRRLWDELRLDRDGTLVALGGGTTTDVAGFVAATYLRGVAWSRFRRRSSARSTRRSAARPGIDLETGKNLVGAFHFPEAVVIDPSCSRRFPPRSAARGWPRS